MFRKQLAIFATALSFFTRIPTPLWAGADTNLLDRALRYFPLMGILTGAFLALVFLLTDLIWPASISLLLALAAGVLFTGALHEDGFMDVCDGFGGGWTKERILEIMKDSHTGAFGMLGILLLILLKYFLFYEIASLEVPPNRSTGKFEFYHPLSFYNYFFILPGHMILIINLVAASSLSRFAAVLVTFCMPYARNDHSSKIGAAANGARLGELIPAALMAPLPLLLFQNYLVFILIVPPIILSLLLRRYFKKWIGGYTGDCLGATQQIAELVYYLSFLALWNII